MGLEGTVVGHSCPETALPVLVSGSGSWRPDAAVTHPQEWLTADSDSRGLGCVCVARSKATVGTSQPGGSDGQCS